MIEKEARSIDIIFDIFKDANSHVSWDRYIEFALRCPDLNIGQKGQYARALQFLRGELGEQFLKTSHRNHPLVRRIVEKGGWRAIDLIGMVKTLKSLKKGDSNYPKLQGKLVSMSSCETEAIPFIDIASMYLRAGFNVRFPDEVANQSNPDIKLSFPGSPYNIYIEVSRLGESSDRLSSADNYDILHAALNNGDYILPHSCKQLSFITDGEMPGVLQKIRACLEQAYVTQGFVHYTDDKVRLGAAHSASYPQLEDWVEQNDYRKGLQGVDLSFNETRRIADYKIKEEASQIPLDASGLVYLPVNTLYFWDFDFEKAVHLFQHAMKAYPNLIGIAFYGYLIYEAKPCSLHVEGNFYGVKRMNDVTIRHLCFVRNRYFNQSLPESIIKKIYTSFD